MTIRSSRNVASEDDKLTCNEKDNKMRERIRTMEECDTEEMPFSGARRRDLMRS